MVYLQSILYIASIYLFYFLGKKKLCSLETIVWLGRVQSFLSLEHENSSGFQETKQNRCTCSFYHSLRPYFTKVYSVIFKSLLNQRF